MKYPKFINKNDCIGVIAPSSGAHKETKINKYKNAIKRFESLGYKLKLSDNLFNDEKGRSASILKRSNEFNEMIKDSNVDLILCASGGDFLIEILPYVNFELIKDNLKYICGFSDPTGLLYPLTTKYDVATIYGQNFSPFGMNDLHSSQEDFLDIISGKKLSENGYDMYEDSYSEEVTGLENYNLNKKVIYKELNNNDVEVSGRIIGGCIDIIAELLKTKYDGFEEFNSKYKNDGIIWYFDNCEQNLDEMIRLLWKFNELGYFKYTKAIIFGRFGVETSNYGYDTLSCLKDSVISKLGIPIIYDVDISHKSPCLTIINGSIANIKLINGKFSITFELK